MPGSGAFTELTAALSQRFGLPSATDDDDAAARQVFAAAARAGIDSVSVRAFGPSSQPDADPYGRIRWMAGDDVVDVRVAFELVEPLVAALAASSGAHPAGPGELEQDDHLLRVWLEPGRDVALELFAWSRSARMREAWPTPRSLGLPDAFAAWLEATFQPYEQASGKLFVFSAPAPDLLQRALGTVVSLADHPRGLAFAGFSAPPAAPAPWLEVTHVTAPSAWDGWLHRVAAQEPDLVFAAGPGLETALPRLERLAQAGACVVIGLVAESARAALALLRPHSDPRFSLASVACAVAFTGDPAGALSIVDRLEGAALDALRSA